MASLSPSAAELATLQQLYDDGRFPAALEAAQPFGPLEQWRDTDALILAGRLARHLGAGGLGMRLILRAWRHDPGRWRARYHRFWILLDYRGPVTAWRELKHFPTCHALPHAFEYFGDEVRCAEPFFAVLAALGRTDLFRTHEVPRVKAVLETLKVF